MSLYGAANFFPLNEPDVEVGNGDMLHFYRVGDLVVPLVAFDQEAQLGYELAVGTDGEQDETGQVLTHGRHHRADAQAAGALPRASGVPAGALRALANPIESRRIPN